MTHTKIERTYDVGIEWEYKVGYFNDTQHVADFPQALQKWLDELGEDGWNLICITSVYFFVFKRPKR